MEINEYKMVQIKRESESDVFNEDFDLSRVKLEPCQIGMSSERGKLDGYKSERDLIDHKNASLKHEEQKNEKYGSAEKNTEDVDFAVLSTPTCKAEKTEDDIDIDYEYVKTEIDDRKPEGNGHYEIYERNVVSESTPFLCITSGKVHEKIRVEETQLRCKISSKAFSTSDHLTVHKRIYSGEKPFHCNICSKSFTDSSNLKVHEKIHTGKKPFNCKICSKSFTESSNLKRHERIHTGEKPFHCKICSKFFNELNNLRRHERIHTGEKPFHCKICSKSFTQLEALKVHERIHSGEKPYQCKICSKAFSQLSNLKRHEKVHTGGESFKQMDAKRQ